MSSYDTILGAMLFAKPIKKKVVETDTVCINKNCSQFNIPVAYVFCPACGMRSEQQSRTVTQNWALSDEIIKTGKIYEAKKEYQKLYADEEASLNHLYGNIVSDGTSFNMSPNNCGFKAMKTLPSSEQMIATFTKLFAKEIELLTLAGFKCEVVFGLLSSYD